MEWFQFIFLLQQRNVEFEVVVFSLRKVPLLEYLGVFLASQISFFPSLKSISWSWKFQTKSIGPVPSLRWDFCCVQQKEGLLSHLGVLEAHFRFILLGEFLQRSGHRWGQGCPGDKKGGQPSPITLRAIQMRPANSLVYNLNSLQRVFFNSHKLGVWFGF